MRFSWLRTRLFSARHEELRTSSKSPSQPEWVRTIGILLCAREKQTDCPLDCDGILTWLLPVNIWTNGIGCNRDIVCCSATAIWSRHCSDDTLQICQPAVRLYRERRIPANISLLNWRSLAIYVREIHWISNGGNYQFMKFVFQWPECQSPGAVFISDAILTNSGFQSFVNFGSPGSDVLDSNVLRRRWRYDVVVRRLTNQCEAVFAPVSIRAVLDNYAK